MFPCRWIRGTVQRHRQVAWNLEYGKLFCSFPMPKQETPCFSALLSPPPSLWLQSCLPLLRVNPIPCPRIVCSNAHRTASVRRAQSARSRPACASTTTATAPVTTPAKPVFAPWPNPRLHPRVPSTPTVPKATSALPNNSPRAAAARLLVLLATPTVMRRRLPLTVSPRPRAIALLPTSSPATSTPTAVAASPAYPQKPACAAVRRAPTAARPPLKINASAPREIPTSVS